MVAPGDPLLLSGLAMALARATFYVGDAGVARARDVAQRAVQAAPQLGEAQLAYGSMLFQLGENTAAVRALRAAVQRSPGLAEAHATLGRLLLEAGAVDEGVRLLDMAITLDPGIPLVRSEVARAHALRGQWDEADAATERLLERDRIGYWTLRARLAMWRRQAESLEAAMVQLPDNDVTLRLPRLMLKIVRTGEVPPDMIEMGKTERGLGGTRRQAFTYQLHAEVVAYVRDDELTLLSLQRALDVGLIDRLWLERCPLLAAVRETPRFAEIHAEMVRRTDAILEAYRAP